MFKKISDSIRLTYPIWVKRNGDGARYERLDLYDRLLDGTFYDHLSYGFYDEKKQDGSLIPLIERRPSAQFRLPRMVARWCSRKLFAGRHTPKIRHPNVKLAAKITKILQISGFFQTMNEAVLLGSVGSVACTFAVEIDGDRPAISFELWRAKYCQPSFDPDGDLAQLRVAYTVQGSVLKSMDAPGVEADQVYWYIRDWTPEADITYEPVKKDDWNPIDGFTTKPNQTLTPWEGRDNKHDLGFVMAHWFTNLPGGIKPDGQCTFEDAIPNSIEIDYTLSQVGRGVRYNCAPTPVIIGRMLNDFERGAVQTHIALEAGYKQQDGETIGAGDAKLLEMTGRGTESALALIKELRNFALEQIAASRKDPDKMKGPLSGRAMEYLDEDSNDLVNDLRSAYGDHGALPLLKKVILAAKLAKPAEISGFTLQWPRSFQPTPEEVLSLVSALVAALDPLKKSKAATPASRPASAQGQYVDAAPATGPSEEEQLLTVAEAKMLLHQILDLSMTAGEDEMTTEEPEDVDSSPTAPGQATPRAPEPLPLDDGGPQPDQPTNAPNSAVQAADAVTGGMNVLSPVTVGRSPA